MEPITQKKKLLMALGGILLTGCLIFGIYSTLSSSSSSRIASSEAPASSSSGGTGTTASKPKSSRGKGALGPKLASSSFPSKLSSKSTDTDTDTALSSNGSLATGSVIHTDVAPTIPPSFDASSGAHGSSEGEPPVSHISPTATAATTATLVPTSQSSGGASKPMSSDGTAALAPRPASSPLKPPSESAVTATSVPDPASLYLNGSLATGSVFHTDVTPTVPPSFETGRYGYMVITNQESYQNFENYRMNLLSAESEAGASLSDKMPGNSINSIVGMTTDDFINLMLSTKIPKAFAEETFPLYNPTWTVKEFELLGDINIAMPVKIYDHGEHFYPTPHSTAIEGYLLFTPGVLLVEDCVADYRHIVKNYTIDFDAYYKIYERRLLPLLKFASDEAGAKGTKAVVTVPGIGCGAFSGTFAFELNARFGEVLHRILEEHGEKLPNISLVYFYQFLENFRILEYPSRQTLINGIDYLVSSNITDPNSKILLESPASFGDKYKDDILFAFVAWDHLSFPGNDYFEGKRKTDDGVMAAATSSMTSLLKFPGNYVNPMYRVDTNSKPSVSDEDFSGCRTWGEISNTLHYELNINDGGLYVLQDGTLEEHRPIGRKFTFEELYKIDL